MLLAGAVAFFQEVLWSRMLSHVLGSSIHAFGVMVASFLAGIAIGGALGAGIARTRARAAVALGIALLIAALAAAVAYLLLARLMPGTAGLLALPMNTLFAGLLLLPMTIAIGMTYPLAVRVLAADANDAAPASARVYAWNTAGAIFGSLAAGFVLIPALKFEGSIEVAVNASAALGVLALWTLLPVHRISAIATTLVAIVACAFYRPAAPTDLLVASPLNLGKGRVLFYDVGRSASVVMLAEDGGLALRTNGLPEALMDTPGSLQQFGGEYWLSPLAVLARPNTRDMLVVGFGGGVVIDGVPPSVKKIDVIELEPKVIDANRAVAAMRKHNPLIDPRLNVIINDARSALHLTSRRYDAIVSQPSHPWTAGASHLYTREFMSLAHDHLTPGGVFVQWMNVSFLDETLLRSLTATLLDVFREVRVYRPDPGTLVFLASDAPLELEQQLAETGAPLNWAPLHFARFGINNLEDLVTALAFDTRGARELAAGAQLITDDDNRLATSNVFETQRGMTGESVGRFLGGVDPLQREDSLVYQVLRERLSFPYIARRASVFALNDASVADRIRRITQILGSGADAEYTGAYFYRIVRQPQRQNEMLRIGIEEYPNDDNLRLEFLRESFGDLARDAAPPEIAEVASSLKGLPAGILAAARRAAKGEWLEVAKAEDLLAQVRWSDAWSSEAMELRINWRNQVPNPKFRKQSGDDAIRLIDRLALMNPTPGLYALRATAGLAAQRPDVVVESISNYARLASALTRAGYGSADALRRDARTLLEMLDAVAKIPGIDAARVVEVRAEMTALSQSR
jgi:predicted membrane-bound spermidine synthase